MQYLIRLSKPATETASGLALPETVQQNHTEGTVLAAGSGMLPPNGERYAMECEAGDVVIFQRDDWKPLDEERGFVHEEDLVAIRDGDEVVPANDWVLIIPDARQRESAGGIHIPERYQRRGRSGMAPTLGPGRFRHKGALEGTRQHPLVIMGLVRSVPEDGFSFFLLDSPPRVYWGAEALTVTIRGEGLDFICVRAGDLCALE